MKLPFNIFHFLQQSSALSENDWTIVSLRFPRPSAPFPDVGYENVPNTKVVGNKPSEVVVNLLSGYAMSL
jgi:hypothetical protein